MESRDRWVDLDGPVFYQEWEGPPGLTFVCLHGLGGSHLNWMLAAPMLSRLGRVLVMDFAGSGLTPRAGRSSGVSANRALLSGFVHEIAGGPVVLCGNSLGGSIALLQAACEPETVVGLALNGAALPPAAGRAPSVVVVAGTAIYALPALGEALGWLRIRALPPETLISLGFRMVLGDASRVPDEVVRAHVDMVRRLQADPDSVHAFVQTTRSILTWMQRPDVARRYMASVRKPVLLMHGGSDRVVPKAPTLAAAPAHWDILELSGLGHVFQLEAPEVWLGAVEDWLVREGLRDQG